jgi:hypothetical protein
MESLKNNTNKIILSKNIYFIIDNKNEERTDFVNENDKWELKIDVRNNVENVFFDNERHIMNLSETKKCDWLLFNNTHIFFIEAKDVKPSKRGKERKDAKLKFRDTINFYKHNFNIPESSILNAVLNFRNNKEITGAASKENKAYYKEILGLNYYEQNVLIIDR